MTEKNEKGMEAVKETKPKRAQKAEEFSQEAVDLWARLHKICNLSAIAAEIGEITPEGMGDWARSGKGCPEVYVDRFCAVTGIPLELVRPDVKAKRDAEAPTPKQVRAMEREAAKNAS